MKTSTTRYFNALVRRPSDRIRVVVLLVALVSMVAVLGLTPGVIPTRPAASVGPTPELGEPVEPEESAERNTVATTTPTTAPDPVELRVVADPRPGDLRVDPTADVLPEAWGPTEAADVRSDLAYGPDPLHRYDLYLPADAADAPVILYLHSGGWIGGDRSFVPDMVLRFLDHGYAIASVDYRLAPASVFPGPVEDVKRAVREIKAMGVATGLIDPDRIVVYGTSAGGHLAAFAATTVGLFEPPDLTAGAREVDSAVAAIVSAVGPTDLVQLYSHPNAWAAPMSGTFMGCFPNCTAEQLEVANPGRYLHADIPPAYWVYGSLDPLVDATAQGLVIAQQWADAGGESWIDIVDDGDHNLDETLANQRAIEDFVLAATGS